MVTTPSRRNRLEEDETWRVTFPVRSTPLPPPPVPVEVVENEEAVVADDVSRVVSGDLHAIDVSGTRLRDG